jgi:Fur family transcriptional regulator, ferric uptake regulator
VRRHRDRPRRRAAPPPARASVYRALEQLELLGLVQRIEVSRGVAGYERVEADGHHHHHAICRDCGRMVPFEDPTLERAIGRVSESISFDVSEHDVVLRGRCERCSG